MMITQIKHFFIGGIISGALLAFKNVYINLLGSLALGYLVICGLEIFVNRLKEMSGQRDDE